MRGTASAVLHEVVKEPIVSESTPEAVPRTCGRAAAPSIARTYTRSVRDSDVLASCRRITLGRDLRPPHRCRARLRDRSDPPPFRARVLARREPQVRLELVRAREPV